MVKISRVQPKKLYTFRVLAKSKKEAMQLISKGTYYEYMMEE